MRVGLALPQFDISMPGERPLRWESVAAWARRAEAAGFDSLWLADHLFWDVGLYGGPPHPVGSLEPLATLGALARITTRPRLGTLVLGAPLRPPTVLAKALATVDVVSGGRLVVGVGAGWYEPEFAASGVPFLSPGQRLDQLEEAIAVLRGMFGGGPFSFSGRHWTVEEAMCLPRPVQRPAPPIVVGGKGDRLIDLVARCADGWNTVWRWTPDRYAERLGTLARACEGVGRDPGTVRRSLGLTTLVGESEADLRRRYERLQSVAPPGVMDGVPLDEWRQGRLVGTVEQVQEQVAGWAELGVDELVVNAGPVPFTVVDVDDLETIATGTNVGDHGKHRSP